MENVLNIKNRREFREWLNSHHAIASQCWVELKRGKPLDEDHFYYLDAVEEALCFGWIDSTQAVIEGKRMQRFSPRQKKSPWTELNKERVRRLEKLGLMTEAGRVVLPPMGPESFQVLPEIEGALREAGVWCEFQNFPPLYQRIRAYNLAFYLNRGMMDTYQKGLAHLIDETRKGKMYGEWNDYGRLIDY